MAKTQQSEEPGEPWPAEGWPIDAAYKLMAPSAWDAFVSAWRAAARDLDGLRRISLLALNAATERRLTAYKDAQTALGLEREGVEFWARPGSPIAEFERIPPSAVSGLELDPESRTARGKNIPVLYDVHLRRVPSAVANQALLPVGQRPPAALIKASWRDRVPEATLKSAMEGIAKSYDGKPQPPTFTDVWSQLKARFGQDFPRDAARAALKIYAPQLKRSPGQTSKSKSRS